MTGRNHRAPGSGRPRDLRELRDVVRSDGKVGGFDLPEGVFANGEDWHPATRRWWDSWRRSPQGVKMMTAPDWDYLLDTALLHHQMWQSGGKNSERAAEIRMRVAAFGATPADRARLRMEIEVPEDFPVGDRGSDNVASLDARRRRIPTAPGGPLPGKTTEAPPPF